MGNTIKAKHFRYVSLGKGKTSKNKEMGLYQNKNLLHRDGNHQQIEKTTC